MRAKRTDGWGSATCATTGTAAPSRDARFEEVFREHRDDVWRYCMRRLRADEVNDAVSDVFVVVWRRLDDLPEGDESRLWIFGIARNTIRNRQRSGRRRMRLDGRMRSLPSRTSPGADEVAYRDAEHRELLDAVDRLPDDDRELLRLRTWEELSLADIAQLTGLSVRAVEASGRRQIPVAPATTEATDGSSASHRGISKHTSGSISGPGT